MSRRTIYAFQRRLWAEYLAEKSPGKRKVIGAQMIRNHRALVKMAGRG